MLYEISEPRYIAILGKTPKISKAELAAIFPRAVFPVGGEGWTLVEGAADLELRRVGGIVKWARCVAVQDTVEYATLAEHIIAHIQKDTGKITFGMSSYGRVPVGLKTLLIGVKKALVDLGRGSRFVNQDWQNVSSAVVELEGLVRTGAEVLVAGDGERLYIGITQEVQPFDEYRKRDYEKAARDTEVGMLPPKLAQMLVNIGTQGRVSKVYDPFCGTGTILVEAHLLGHMVEGSDLSPDMVAAAKRNMVSYDAGVQIFPHDASMPTRIDADVVVTEGYLGTPFRQAATSAATDKITADLVKLYTGMCGWLRVKRLTLCLPVWAQVGTKALYASTRVIPALAKVGWQVEAGPWLYARPNQWVGREVWCLVRGS